MGVTDELLGVGLTFGVSCLLTGLIRRYAIARGLLDHPNQRSSHTMPTPRGGGLAIVVAFACALLFLGLHDNFWSAPYWALGCGGGLVAAVGWLDDCGHVGVGWRIAAHGLAVGVGLSWLGGLPPLPVAGWVIPAGAWLNWGAGIALVWLLNLFNFMDGIDGLAAMEASFVALAAATILTCRAGWGQEARQLLLFACACLGFLTWNWPPAKIFMGDVGSGFLGYAIGILAVLSLRSGTISLPVWLILLAAFIIDATVTLVARVIRGERWHEAHRSHAYQGAARRYRSHRKVTLGVLAINLLWLFPLAFWAALRPTSGWLLVLGAWAPLVFLVLRERSRQVRSIGMESSW